jgi:hypothetical protein
MKRILGRSPAMPVKGRIERIVRAVILRVFIVRY